MNLTTTKNPGKTKNLLIAAAIAAVGVGGLSYPLAASAVENSTMQSSASAPSVMHSNEYMAKIKALNNTNVKGTAYLKLVDNNLSVRINATGLEPGVHPQHIHGKEQANAECPKNSADLNKDGYVSVVEGAPSYGLIKVNLTSPQTAFGTPPTPALFAPFAGTADNKNFPVVGSDGILNFEQTYTFNDTAAAQAAFKSLTPLGDQEIVLHGATAPKSVDADAFAALGAAYAPGTDLSVKSYDALLPAGCGEIDPVAAKDEVKNNDNHSGQMTIDAASLAAGLASVQGQLTNDLTEATSEVADPAAFSAHVGTLSTNFSASVQLAVSNYQTSITSGVNKDEARNQLINSLASAKDAELNGLTEARNQQIDTLNQLGDVSVRDSFLNGFDKTAHAYTDVLENVKNQL